MDTNAGGLSQHFNEHSVSSVIGHVATHVLTMGAMMGIIALASPAAAGVLSLGGADPVVTLGNLIVQTGFGAGEMLGMISDSLSGLISIGGDLISNTLNGDIAPTSWDSLIASHDMGHGSSTALDQVSGHMGHHGADTAFSGLAHSTLSPMDWFGTLPEIEQIQMREDAALFGIPFEEYIADWCDTTHPNFNI